MLHPSQMVFSGLTQKYYIWSLKNKMKGDMRKEANIREEKYIVSREKKKEGKGGKSIGFDPKNIIFGLLRRR